MQKMNTSLIMKDTNPITKMDFPDPDVIRVADTYYMVSTTMHFMPGCVILRSYDLIHWEIATHIYDVLDSTPGQCLKEKKGIYGKGMWAASIRYHNNKFYVCFVANDTGKTYLFTSNSVEGEWEKQIIEGFYHDCSLLFDDDERVYIVYGNASIHLTELDNQLRSPKKGGIDRIILSEKDNYILGYEGSHFYKINGKYYLFLIHSPGETWFRREACFMSDCIDGEFVGKDVLSDDLNYCNQGVAQGGIVDTPDGTWYGILFQDRGAVGRIPVLLPIKWENDFPVFGDNGKVPEAISVHSTRPDYVYKPLYASDDFCYRPDSEGKIYLKEVWEFNHEPSPDLWSISDKDSEFRIQSGCICKGIEEAVNTLTQRTLFSKCAAEVTVNGMNLSVGDYAGISAFQGCYGFVALKKEADGMYLVMVGKPNDDACNTEIEYEKVRLSLDTVRLKVSLNFADMKDEANFYYQSETGWKKIGITHKLYFKLDHFCGCRFGLFMYSTSTPGGMAGFRDFCYLSQ